MNQEEAYLQILEEVKTHRKPLIPLSLRMAEESEDIETGNVLASKIRGMPYWEEGVAFPVDTNGTPLQMLAQINLALMPQLPHFPSTGILQFFIADDDQYGIDDGLNRTIYWPDPDMRRAASYPVMEMEFCPAESPMWIEPGEIRMEDCGSADYRHGIIYPDVWKAKSVNFAWHTFKDMLGDRVNNEGCRMGGYAFFTQSDPRSVLGYEPVMDPPVYAAPDNREFVQLLQLDSEDGAMMWGDTGVAHWFILREDLERLDFSKVFYTWDCC
jgi:uncharacterized protein YwqG